MELSPSVIAFITALSALVVYALSKFGIVVPDTEVTTVLTHLAVLGSVAYAWYRRYQKGDVTVLGRRK